MVNFPQIGKLEDWEQRLSDHFDEYNNSTDYTLGVNDCYMFCIKAVEAQTGVNIIKGINYSTMKQAIKLLKNGATLNNVAEPGPQTTEGFFTRLLGEPNGPLFAQRGHIVLMPNHFEAVTKDNHKLTLELKNPMDSVGVVDMTGSCILMKTKEWGVITTSIHNGVKSWGVDNVTRG